MYSLSEMPQRILTKKWPSANPPQQAPRCRRRTHIYSLWGTEECSPVTLQNTITGESSADAWVGHTEGLRSAGSSQQELGREKAGKPGDGLYHGHPSQPGTGESLPSPLCCWQLIHPPYVRTAGQGGALKAETCLFDAGTQPARPAFLQLDKACPLL